MRKFVIFTILLLLAIILSGCIANDRQIIINTAVQAVNSVNDFETTIVNENYVEYGHGLPYAEAEVKWLAPNHFYAKCLTKNPVAGQVRNGLRAVSADCWFALKQGDILITDGVKQYRYSAATNTYSEQPIGDFAQFTTRMLEFRSNVASIIQQVMNLLNFSYAGIVSVDGEETHLILFSRTSTPLPPAEPSTTEYKFYIRTSDYMPIKFEDTIVKDERLFSRIFVLAEDLRINTGLTPDDFDPARVFASARRV